MMELTKIELLVRGFLSEKRYVHARAVAKEAMRLAKRYGADAKKAQVAGLLHDIMKEMSGDIQLKTIADSGIVLNEIERKSKNLWHQVAAAAYVQDVLRITDEDLLCAIRYHTAGRGGMSLLEKVIFVADFTSEDRDYSGVQEMRRLADQSLEKAMAEGISFTIATLAKNKEPILVDTILAYNDAVNQRG